MPCRRTSHAGARLAAGSRCSSYSSSHNNHSFHYRYHAASFRWCPRCWWPAREPRRRRATPAAAPSSLTSCSSTTFSCGMAAWRPAMASRRSTRRSGPSAAATEPERETLGCNPTWWRQSGGAHRFRLRARTVVVKSTSVLKDKTASCGSPVAQLILLADSDGLLRFGFRYVDRPGRTHDHWWVLLPTNNARSFRPWDSLFVLPLSRAKWRHAQGVWPEVNVTVFR